MSGSKAAQVETIVIGDVDCAKVTRAVLELCQLIQAKRRGNVGDFSRDMAAAAEVAARSAVVFRESVSLFPASVHVAAATDVATAPFDMGAIVSELQGSLRGLHEQLAVYQKATHAKQQGEERAFVQQSLGFAATSGTGGDASPDLVAALTDFGACINKFTRMYSDEMASWKVEAREPNMHLSELATDLRKKQKVYDELLRCHEIVRSSYEKMNTLAKQMDTLETAAVAEESIAALQKSVTLIQRLKET